MKSDGKQLESLVAFVEHTLLPKGFQVKTNERIFNDEGIQIAEFDVEIKGKVGSTDIHWLIECRDRPGQGAAPGSWIEQLVGRRSRFGFNKITAVSTTGFAVGAIEFAQDEGIELREVRALTPEEFKSWCNIQFLTEIHSQAILSDASFQINESESKEVESALSDVLSKVTFDSRFLRSITTGVTKDAPQVFLDAVVQNKLFDLITKRNTPKPVRFRAVSSDDDYYVVDTTLGPVRIQAIHFVGELIIKETQIPLNFVSEYRHIKSGEFISQVAAFAPQTIFGQKVSLEMHRIPGVNEMQLILRKLPSET